MNKNQQSMLDYLVDSLDQLEHLRQTKDSSHYVSGQAASDLFEVWNNKHNKISDRIVRRPPTMSLEDVNHLKREGLVRDLGDKLEITSKGSKVIKIMILGDERSSFENNDTEISYAEARANTRERSIKTSIKKNEQNWWERALK